MYISDSHNDFLSVLDQNSCTEYLDCCRDSGVINLLCSEFTSEYENDIVDDKLLLSKKIIDDFNCLNYKLHIEDLTYINSKKRLDNLLKLNPYSVSLTWNFDNKYAGGNFGTSGLTEHGKTLILNLIKNNITIDVAHLNKKSFYDVSEFLNKPIFCSHTGLNYIHKSDRNLSDKQVYDIINSNGYVGIFLSPKFLSDDNIMTVDKFSKIIIKIINKFGYKNIGIGSDFYGMEKDPIDIKDYNDISRIKIKLLNYGVSEEMLNMLFYKNFDNFYKKY